MGGMSGWIGRCVGGWVDGWLFDYLAEWLDGYVVHGSKIN